MWRFLNWQVFMSQQERHFRSLGSQSHCSLVSTIPLPHLAADCLILAQSFSIWIRRLRQSSDTPVYSALESIGVDSSESKTVSDLYVEGIWKYQLYSLSCRLHEEAEPSSGSPRLRPRRSMRIFDCSMTRFKIKISACDFGCCCLSSVTLKLTIVSFIRTSDCVLCRLLLQ